MAAAEVEVSSRRESSTLDPCPCRLNDPVDTARLERRLPTLLSIIAGMVDVIGFLSLGLFTAHVTGNLVVIAALLVRGGPPKMAQILAVPVFIVAVGEHNDEVLKELGFELAADGFKRAE